jgi:oligopeptidase B
MDAYFSSTRSLLDRGFVYAIAHIRGGEDLGRQWYEGGYYTFKDFIATYLIDQNILLQHICMLKVDLLVDY